MLQVLPITAALLLVGAVLVTMALAEPLVRRLPLSPALVYLLCGWLAGLLATPPLPDLDLEMKAPLIRLLSEIAVLLSLFAIGLKIRVSATWLAWRVPVLLATVGMMWSVLLASLLAWLLLPLSWPMALLLAAILAPTDPVLASDVQIHHQDDRDGLRVALSAEGALNDATAYPVVMLALGLLGMHELGDHGSRWLTLDVIWSVAAGGALGVACGRGLGWAMQKKLEAGAQPDWDELLYLGAIALTYGLALVLQVSPFLAVFATGVTLLRQHPAAKPEPVARELGDQLQNFGAHCERLVEVLMVLLIGASLPHIGWSLGVAGFALLMLILVRPASVFLSLPRSALPPVQRNLAAWFGIRGVGSIFYLTMSMQQGVGGTSAQVLVSACLSCIALSIALHGISSTPLMSFYQNHRTSRRKRTV